MGTLRGQGSANRARPGKRSAVCKSIIKTNVFSWFLIAAVGEYFERISLLNSLETKLCNVVFPFGIGVNISCSKSIIDGALYSSFIRPSPYLPSPKTIN